jgi:hypothetical protein
MDAVTAKRVSRRADRSHHGERARGVPAIVIAEQLVPVLEGAAVSSFECGRSRDRRGVRCPGLFGLAEALPVQTGPCKPKPSTLSCCGPVTLTAPGSSKRPFSQLGRVQPSGLHFAKTGSSFAEARELIRGIEEAKRVFELHRGTHRDDVALDFTRRVVSALDAF